MRQMILVTTLMLCLLIAPARAGILDSDGVLSMEATYSLGQGNATLSVDPAAPYSNITSYTGNVITPGGISGTSFQVTSMVADDIQFTAAAAGNPITLFRFAVVNLNSSAYSCQPYVRFYSDSGNAPTTFLRGFNLSERSFPALSMSIVSFTVPLANQWNVPADGRMWAGMGFMGTNGVGFNLLNMGIGFFNPVDVGTSQDQDFYSATGGGTNSNAFMTNFPPGTVRTSPYPTRQANYGWEFVALPEPQGIGLIGLVMACFGRRHRR